MSLVLTALLAATLGQAQPADPVDQRLQDRLDQLSFASSEDAAPLVAEIRALWESDASDTSIHLMDQGLLAETAGRLDIAARMYDHVNRYEPEFAEAWLRTARVAAAQQDWGYALESLDRVITLEPRRFDAYVMLGNFLEQTRELQAAQEAYREALELYPNYDTARSAYLRVQRELEGRSL
ncbi:tetratricopeptide repeat protein [Maricaulis sp. D1M11]|uniref:tetratricopeptide repeat protein n=1 Tax=Maricaulis sp. D1M11 TaxID=3076117 RepID=UPI0039B399F7